MYSFQVKKRDYIRISMILGIICVGGLIVSLFLYDVFIDAIIRWQIPLVSGTIARKMYLKLPFPLEFHVHIFDIQNAEDVQNGAKPQLKDIGPYVFHEYILKHDIVDNKENDTLEFTLRKTWIFKPELSNGLTGDENVTTLHPVLNSLALAINVNRKPLLPMISDTIRIMFQPKTPFWTGRAMDFLFDGIPIDCSSSNFKVRAICAVFEAGENAAIQQVAGDATKFKFSLLGSYNGSSNGQFKVYRGKKEITDAGRVIEVDEQPEMDAWFSDEENCFKGTDGYFIPPFRSIHDEIWAFERALCMSLGLKYQRKSYNRGIPVRTFAQNFNRFHSNKAYCRENGTCPIKGTIDLFNCVGVPIIASLPHFLDADQSLLDNIASGLSPNKKNHGIFASIDLKTGVPIAGAKRVQLSFEVAPIAQVEVMQHLPHVVLPFVWIEERFRLPGVYVTLLHLTLILSRRLIDLIKLLSVIVVPLAAIASLTIHLLIKYQQISVIDNSPGTIIDKDADAANEAIKAIKGKIIPISHGEYIN